MNPPLAFCANNQRFNPPAGHVDRNFQAKVLGAIKRKQLEMGDARFSFVVYAGVGAGKTTLAAMIAADMLRRRKINRVVFVCNNCTIKDHARAEFRRWNIHLADWHSKKHGRRGEPPTSNGITITYQALAVSPHTHAALAARKRTLVIFDEIHHLAEEQAWAEAAAIAFEGRAQVVLGLTGTPFRSKAERIPFAEYKQLESGLWIIDPDEKFTLGDAVALDYCCRPAFRWLSPTVVVDRGNGKPVALDFKMEGLTDDDASLILNECIRPGSDARRQLLKETIDFCRVNGRDGRPLKLIIFVDRKIDADTWLPMELREFGIGPEDILPVTSDDREAPEKIRRFGQSKQWILTTVDMVSEGTNIVELEVACFLSNVTARVKVFQRTGRIVRSDAEGRLIKGKSNCYVFGFKHPVLLQIGNDIEKEIQHACSLKESGEVVERPSGGNGSRPATEPPTPKAIATSARLDGLTVGGEDVAEHAYQKARDICDKAKLDVKRDVLGIARVINQGLWGGQS